MGIIAIASLGGAVSVSAAEVSDSPAPDREDAARLSSAEGVDPNMAEGLISGSQDAARLSSAEDVVPNVPTLDPTERCKPARKFRENNFDHPKKINNKYLPLVPGTRYTLTGTINTDTGPVPHSIVLTITDLTKVIDGVPTRVVWDQDFSEGQLAESELAFFAQDDPGNVWNLGEYPEEFENGKFVGAPSTWFAGLERAKPGIHMFAHPREGTDPYLQGKAPKIDFYDCAQVVDTDAQLCVPASCDRQHNDVVTEEWSPLDPEGGFQIKGYQPEVGNILVEALGDPEGETLQLTDISHLNCEELRDVDNAVLKIEKHAYQVSDVYAKTQPIRSNAPECGGVAPVQESEQEVTSGDATQNINVTP